MMFSLIKSSWRPNYRVGDAVLLDQSALEQWSVWKLAPSRKLRPQRYGPFTVTKVDGLNVTLNLPPTLARLHPTFHVSLLTPFVPSDHAPAGLAMPPPELVDGAEEFEVEEILGERMYRRKKQYLVKWKGYTHEHNTYEPPEHLTHCADRLKEYQAQLTSIILSEQPAEAEAGLFLPGSVTVPTTVADQPRPITGDLDPDAE
jgi:Chromo (CHRromatin Organisation MOdifier) domain